MISSNGKIPAGTVSFNISSMKLGKLENSILPIDKCPDKSATVEHSTCLEFVREGELKNSMSQSSIDLKLNNDNSLKKSRFDSFNLSSNAINPNKDSLEKKNPKRSYEKQSSARDPIFSSVNVAERDSDDIYKSRVSGYDKND